MKNMWNYADEKKHYVDLILNEAERRFGEKVLWEKPRETLAFRVEDEERKKVCCFTGNRTSKLTRSPEVCKHLLVGAIMDSYEKDYRIFISGMAEGVDRWAAMAILTLRCFFPDVRLVTAMPFPSRKKEGVLDEETMILSEADENRELSKAYWQGAYETRNEWMVNMSSRVIALMDEERSGSGNTVRYAEKMGRDVIRL